MTYTPTISIARSDNTTGGVHQSPKANTKFSTSARRLQFEGMFEHGGPGRREREAGASKAGGAAGKSRRGKSPQQVRIQSARKQVNDILVTMDQYHQWWTGPDLDRTKLFYPAEWARPHRRTVRSAIFTAAIARGYDASTCSSPNDFHLFLGTARRAGFTGDIVIALEEGQSDAVKSILKEYAAVVYEVPKEICSAANSTAGASSDNFCGSADEHVPASVFRYYFYEKWAAVYNESTSILLADFKDVLFQSDPFVFHTKEWADYQLTVFQEFHPNMVIHYI